MHSRIFAFCILFILICLPVGIYLYLTVQKVASLTVSSDITTPFSVNLVGKFDIEGLPLADKVITYTRTCATSCIINPILPARYEMILSSSGKVDIRDSISIDVGSNINRDYQFDNDLRIIPHGVYNANISTGSTIYSQTGILIEGTHIIGLSESGTIYGWRATENMTQVLKFQSGRWMVVWNIPKSVSQFMTDLSRSILIARFDRGILLFSLTSESYLVEIPDFPDDSDVLSVYWMAADTITIRTEKYLWQWKYGHLEKDIRWTDAIDINQTVRIGYIAGSDDIHRSIANINIPGGTLWKLDRSTGETSLLRSDIDIESFFFYQKKPAYRDFQGNIFLLQY